MAGCHRVTVKQKPKALTLYNELWQITHKTHDSFACGGGEHGGDAAPVILARSQSVTTTWSAPFALNESPGKDAILSSLFRGDTRPGPKGLRHRRSGRKRTSNSSKSYTTRLVVVELANDMERRDKADEAEAHNQHNRGTDLQTRCIVCVEAQHVVAASSESTTTSISRWRRGCPPPSQPRGSCRSSSRPRSRRPRPSSSRCRRTPFRDRRRRLALRSLRHSCGISSNSTDPVLNDEKSSLCVSLSLAFLSNRTLVRSISLKETPQTKP